MASRLHLQQRQAIFLSFVLVAFFWQLFYGNFYGPQSIEKRDKEIQKYAEQANSHYEKSNAFVENYSFHNKRLTEKIDNTVVKQLKADAKGIVKRRMKDFALSCGDKYYFVDESYYGGEVDEYYAVLGFTIKVQHRDKAGIRVYHPKTKDEIHITVTPKDNKLFKHYGDSYSEWYESSYYGKDNLAAWKFTITDEKLTNYPPTVKDSEKKIKQFLSYRYNYYKYPNTTRNKYRCSDIPQFKSNENTK